MTQAVVSFRDIGAVSQPVDFLVTPKRSKGSYRKTWDSSFQGGVEQSSYLAQCRMVAICSDMLAPEGCNNPCEPIATAPHLPHGPALVVQDGSWVYLVDLITQGLDPFCNLAIVINYQALGLASMISGLLLITGMLRSDGSQLP